MDRALPSLNIRRKHTERERERGIDGDGRIGQLDDMPPMWHIFGTMTIGKRIKCILVENYAFYRSRNAIQRR